MRRIKCTQRRSQDFGWGEGGTSDKISSKVTTSNRNSCDLMQKFTQERLLKIFENLY